MTTFGQNPHTKQAAEIIPQYLNGEHWSVGEATTTNRTDKHTFNTFQQFLILLLCFRARTSVSVAVSGVNYCCWCDCFGGYNYYAWAWGTASVALLCHHRICCAHWETRCSPSNLQFPLTLSSEVESLARIRRRRYGSEGFTNMLKVGRISANFERCEMS